MPLIDRRTMSLLSLAAVSAPAMAWAAESYPSRPVHLIVGFTAGATSDVIARIFAKAADPTLGQQIVVNIDKGLGHDRLLSAQDRALVRVYPAPIGIDIGQLPPGYASRAAMISSETSKLA